MILEYPKTALTNKTAAALAGLPYAITRLQLEPVKTRFWLVYYFDGRPCEWNADESAATLFDSASAWHAAEKINYNCNIRPASDLQKLAAIEVRK